MGSQTLVDAAYLRGVAIGLKATQPTLAFELDAIASRLFATCYTPFELPSPKSWEPGYRAWENVHAKEFPPVTLEIKPAGTNLDIAKSD